MTTVKQIFPDRWLRPEHLRGKAHRVAIAAVTIEELFNPRSRQKEPKIVLAFHAKPLRLPLNKTQAFSLAAITHNQKIEEWVGHELVLSPGIAPNRSATIVISAPVPTTSETDSDTSGDGDDSGTSGDVDSSDDSASPDP